MDDTQTEMPIAEARELLQDMRRQHKAYLKADEEAKLGYAGRHRKRIAALDVALKSIDLLSEG
ncbi:hypothetical protein EOA35_09380 [Mesorhizobium sp. M8A.F.Ca.ET.023.01.1.1]|nr:hypothetical protein EOA35_09380 [Mesorhizobium sp. M8A.F.Ca.ET.023.01.1.1]